MYVFFSVAIPSFNRMDESPDSAMFPSLSNHERSEITVIDEKLEKLELNDEDRA